jgi:hypothetical protein
MTLTPRHRPLLLAYVLISAALVYAYAYRAAFTNPYVINDDARQQLYWMQSWTEDGLFENDPLTEYARTYVPIGVKAVYRLAAFRFNPVRFSNVVAGVLFVITAGFLFGLALEFKDDLTAVFSVCMAVAFAGFASKVAGGLSRAFVLPFLTAYLFFLARGRLTAASFVIFIEGFFNPYALLLCGLIHAVFIVVHFGGPLLTRASRAFAEGSASRIMIARMGERCDQWTERIRVPIVDRTSVSPLRLALRALPAVVGLLAVIGQHFVFNPTPGSLVTKAQMVGKPEYGVNGRYEIFPEPSFLYELVRPWLYNLPFPALGDVFGYLCIPVVVALLWFGLKFRSRVIDPSGFKIFLYAIPAGLALYIAARVWLFQLFVPRRYIEYPLHLLYCLIAAICLRMLVERFAVKRFAFPLIATGLMAFGAVQMQNAHVDDYSGDADLCGYIGGLPKDSLIAGHPTLMDNVLTFSRRKAFVTEELSHAWVEPYWTKIKGMTYEFFDAYYAEDPAAVRAFCEKRRITHVIVREKDFLPTTLSRGRVYFEPFDSHIRAVTQGRSRFALLNESEFRPVYRRNGVRVIEMQSDRVIR